MGPQKICSSCSFCVFSRQELCSAYRLAACIHERGKFLHSPDMESYLLYLQSGFSDELAIAVENFIIDLNARLTRKQFEVLISHVYHGRPLKEIARKEGITLEATRQRLNNALTRARHGLGEEAPEKNNKQKRRKKRKRTSR